MDRRAALVASVIANAHRDARKRRRPFRLEDFMPRYGGQEDEQTPEQQAAILMFASRASRRKAR